MVISDILIIESPLKCINLNCCKRTSIICYDILQNWEKMLVINIIPCTKIIRKPRVQFQGEFNQMKALTLDKF